MAMFGRNYKQTYPGVFCTMSRLRDPERYRREDDDFRKKAEAAADNRELRDSYLALAIEYERLADILEKAAPKRDPSVGQTKPKARSRRG